MIRVGKIIKSIFSRKDLDELTIPSNDGKFSETEAMVAYIANIVSSLFGIIMVVVFVNWLIFGDNKDDSKDEANRVVKLTYEQKQEIVNQLRADYDKNPIGGGWVLQSIDASDGTIDIFILIPQHTADSLEEKSNAQAQKIAKMGCPSGVNTSGISVYVSLIGEYKKNMPVTTACE